MLYDFLQVTDEMMDARSRSLSRLLSVGPRKVSHGDALLLMLALDRYFVQRAKDTAPDLKAELRRVATVPADRINDVLSVVSGWPDKHLPALLDALSDPTVGALEAVDDGWQASGLAERYARFAERRRDSRGRATASRMAKERGWKPAEGGGWTHPGTGEVVEDWRALLAKFDADDAVPALRKVNGGVA